VLAEVSGAADLFARAVSRAEIARALEVDVAFVSATHDDAVASVEELQSADIAAVWTVDGVFGRVARAIGWVEALRMSAAEPGSTTSFYLRRDLDRERERAEMRTRFLSLVSHEFRTPLTVIMSSCELLENYGDGWDESRRRAHFRRIQGSIADMTALLDNVSLLAKFDSGNHPVSRDSVLLADTLLAIADEARPFRKEGQELTTTTAPESAFAQVDPRLLHAVAVNLLANACRFSPSDAPVHASLRVVPEGVELVVSDRGPGIPPGEEELVWSAFERGSNSKGVPGSGLGLAIVRRCMELAAGRCELRAREGGGLEAVAVFPAGEPS